MLATALPEDIRAQWIWKTEDATEIESYVFFRREFTLDVPVNNGFLWITACTFFQLYINGRHFCHGPSPALGNVCQVSFFDISHLLEDGENVISVLAHNTQVARAAVNRKPDGFWCQLNIEELPYIWTDDSWLTFPGKCWDKNQPRISKTSGFVENVDLRKFPHGWTENHFDSSDWQTAETRLQINSNPIELEPAPDIIPVSETDPIENLIFRGRGNQEYATTHISFTRSIKGLEGVFVAECYVQIQEDTEDVPVRIISDDPFTFFVNKQLVKKTGSKSLPDWTDPSWSISRGFRQDQSDEEDTVKIVLKSGWNRFLLFQPINLNSSGITFIFPSFSEGEIKFLKQMTSFGLPGWNLAGPLNLPYPYITGSVELEGLPHANYYGLKPCDVAAHLLSYKFEVQGEYDEPVEYINLENGEFAILELDRYQRGFLEFTITGSSGDTVDVLYGDCLKNDFVEPFPFGVRKSITLTLSDGETHWQGVAPHGMLYIMIFARHLTATALIQKLCLRKTSLSLSEQNSFTCSDELMNEMWECGLNTLNATYDYVFLNSGENPQGQKLGDAMIQGITSYFVYGSSQYSEKALREFARAQYETGEMPAVVPSDLNARYFDFSLLWPIWLQQHIFHTGDQSILDDLLPNLEKLLAFFEGISSPFSSLIGNQDSEENNACFLDHDSRLERNGISTAINALYCYSLLKSEWIFSLLGKDEHATNCNKKASRIAMQLRELTWNEEKGLFSDCWYQGKAADSYSIQTNILALYAGIVEPDQKDRIFNNLFFDYAPFQEAIMDKKNENPYFKFFLLDMAFTLERRDWAVEYMRYYWGRMIQKGVTTWLDKFSPDLEDEQENYQSACEGYGVSPNYFLIREVAGIRLAEPNGSRIYFNPVLSTCEWVQVKYQTNQGAVKVEWGHQDSGELQVVIDSDFPLEVVPLLDPKIAANAVMHVSDEVTIIQK